MIDMSNTLYQIHGIIIHNRNVLYHCFVSVTRFCSTSVLLCLFSDIDECLEAARSSVNLCQLDENTVCVNLEGSYECVCVSGYMNISGICQRQSLQ